MTRLDVGTFDSHGCNQKHGDVIVASTIENPNFGSATLFVQLLPAEMGLNRSHYERSSDLERVLFTNNKKLQQQLSGLLGAHKQRISGMSEQAAVDCFWERNQKKLRGTLICLQGGREYVKLRRGRTTIGVENIVLIVELTYHNSLSGYYSNLVVKDWRLLTRESESFEAFLPGGQAQPPRLLPEPESNPFGTRF